MKHLLTNFLRMGNVTNTPPIRLKMRSFLLVLGLLLGSLNVWGGEELVYTLDGTQTGGTSGYGEESSIEQGGITWKVKGNTTMNPWRIGGNSITNENRPIYSEGTISDNVTKIEVTHGTADNITVNSMTVIVSQNEDFSDPESTLTPTFVANDIVTINRPAGHDWTNCYYKIIYNVTKSSTGNKFIAFVKADFYAEESTGGDVIVKTLKSIEVDGMTTSYEVGDAFSFDGTCTATYSVTKNDEPQPDDNKVVTPTEVTSPDMSTTGNKTITVSYTEDAVTKTTTYDITVSPAQPKFIIDGEPLTSTATTEATTKTYTGTDGSSTVDIVFSDGAKKQAVGTGAVNNFSSNPAILIGKTGKNIHNSTPFPGEITKFELYYNKGAANGTSVSVTFSTTPLSEAATSGDNLYTVTFTDDTYKDKVYDCTSKVPEGALYFWYQVTSNSNSQVQFRVTYEEPEPAAVAVPTISGETPFLTSTEVTLACATDGATIYYTTDGTDPKISDTKQEYSAAFDVTSTTTIRAIATKDAAWSAEATPKTFTKIEPDYTTIAAFLAAQPSEDKYIQFAGNVVVTGVNGKNVYVQDESGNAICLYFAENSSWTKGHKVTGMFQAKYATYGNMPEMSIASGKEGSIAATETANIPDPTEITSLAEATINANMCKYVVLKGVYFQGQSLTSKAVDLQDASSNELKFYDNLSLTSGKVLPLTANACDVTGVLISYHQNSPSADINEILPVDATCINAGAAALPTLSTAGSTDEEHPTMVANGESITITPAAGFTSTLNGEPLAAATNISITETESNTVIAVSASRDYYATANATYYFKANPAGTKYAITVVQPAQGGTLEANFVETEAGNTVTLTATPTNSHFTFDGWVVKKTDEPETTPETVTENQFTMPEYGVTVTGSFTEDDKATLTFAKGDADGEEAAPKNIVDYAGEVTLPACPFTYTGYYFIGWKKGDTEEIYQPGAYTITAADVTAGTIAFTAQWAAGSIFEWVAGDHGYTEGQEIGLVNSEPVAIEFAQGGASNTPKYYTSDKTARFYNGGTLTITAPENYLISKIEFTTGDWGVNANKGTLDGKTWTGLAQEVIFTGTATSKVKSLKVYYKAGVASSLEIDNMELAYGANATITPKTVTPAAAASHVEYQIKAGSDDCITLNDNNKITAKSTAGTATIVATIPDAPEYLGTSVEFTVTVSAPDDRKKAYSPNAGFDAISGSLNADIAYAAYDGGGTSAAKINGTAIQLYQPGSGKEYGGFVTVTAVKGCKIDQVKITTATNATKISYSKDGGDLSEPQADNLPASSDYLTPAELNAQSVNLYCMGGGSSNRLYIAAMTVYYTGEPLADPEIAYEPEEQTIVVGDSWSAPVLKNENGVTITSYSSDNEEVATVTNEGVISLEEDALGTATITAHFDGDENFKAADATYTITIISAGDAHLATSVWTLVEDASKLKAGMEIIIANADGTATMAPYTTGNNCKEVSGASLDGKIITPQAGTAIVTLEATGTANQFALKVAEQYLYAASSSSNYLKGRDANEDGNSEWTISITDGKAEVIAQGNNTRNVMRYNSSSKLFSCYSSSTDQSDIAFYARAKEERAGFTVGKLATVCVPYAVAQEDIIGADVFEVAGKNEVGKIVFEQVVSGGMEAGVAYLVQAKAETATFYYSGDPVSEPKNVGKALKGTFTGENFVVGEADNIYFFKDNALWAAKETGVKILANRAWLDMSAVGNAAPSPAPGRRRIVLGVHGEQVATGVESIQPSENGVQKVLINGELFILRGEKMYNVNGQLVK